MEKLKIRSSLVLPVLILLIVLLLPGCPKKRKFELEAPPPSSPKVEWPFILKKGKAEGSDNKKFSLPRFLPKEAPMPRPPHMESHIPESPLPQAETRIPSRPPHMEDELPGRPPHMEDYLPSRPPNLEAPPAEAPARPAPHEIDETPGPEGEEPPDQEEPESEESPVHQEAPATPSSPSPSPEETFPLHEHPIR